MGGAEGGASQLHTHSGARTSRISCVSAALRCMSERLRRQHRRAAHPNESARGVQHKRGGAHGRRTKVGTRGMTCRRRPVSNSRTVQRLSAPARQEPTTTTKAPDEAHFSCQIGGCGSILVAVHKPLNQFLHCGRCRDVCNGSRARGTGEVQPRSDTAAHFHTFHGVKPKVLVYLPHCHTVLRRGFVGSAASGARAGACTRIGAAVT